MTRKNRTRKKSSHQNSPAMILSQTLGSRVDTFQEMMMGELAPFHRRAELIRRRREVLVNSQTRSQNRKQEQSRKREQAESGVIVKATEPVDAELIEAVQKLKEEKEFERVEIREEDKVIAHTTSGDRTQFDEDELVTTKREKIVGRSKPAHTPTMSEASSY